MVVVVVVVHAAYQCFARVPRLRKRAHQRPPTRQKVCSWCGMQPHPRSECRAKDSTCNKCRKRGQFANVCRSGSARGNSSSVQGFLGSTSSTAAPSKWDVNISVNGVQLPFRIETGADKTVISEATFHQHFQHLPLRPPPRQLSGTDGRH